MNTKTISVVASIVFAVLVVGGFFALWTMSKSYPQNLPVSDDLKPIEIDSVKKDAENVLSNLEKNSDIPIPVPTNKMGKENPFS
ncbi:MAG: hypothetical protein M1324_00500 [Patescibacteria group bacterium]|nr:hypothetical protein [Patescibacteria group bacterium]